jgi:hypothetical protein
MPGYVAVSGFKITSAAGGPTQFGPFTAQPSSLAVMFSEFITISTNTLVKWPFFAQPLGAPASFPNGVVIQPNPTNTNSLQFLWDTSEPAGGIVLGMTTPNIITFTSNPDLQNGQFYMNCTGGTCNVQFIWF